MRERIRQYLSSLSAEGKRKAVVFLIIVLFIFISVAGYLASRPGRKAEVQKDQRKEISLEPRLLEKSYLAESQKQMESLRKEFDELKKQKEETPPLPPPSPLPSSTPALPSLPPPPSLPSPPSPPPSYEEKKPEPKVQTFGDIEIVSFKEKEINKEEEKKKFLEKVYLPPSFMEATLLSGLDAPAMEAAKGNPVPALLRVKDIAVLPNRVKANLRGCFVIADGYGSLADERAHMRLISLSCIAKNGQAVIDQKVKGFLVDGDGKIGLRGRVVSKMGSAIARSFLAGLFGGIGETVKYSSMQMYTSPIGTSSVIQPSELAKAGIGGGLATAATEIQKFYLELARQAIPVVEVAATRTVTLVISEGVELEIKEHKGWTG